MPFGSQTGGGEGHARVDRKKRLAARGSDDGDDTIFDFREHWRIVYADFAREYGIRLSEPGTLTWSDFCAMLSGLSSDSRTVQLAHYLSKHPADRHQVDAPAGMVRMSMKDALKLIQPPVDAVPPEHPLAVVSR